MNHTLDDKTPKFDVELDFEEIGFILDKHQYRDVISMVDMYHFFLRNQQVRTLEARPTTCPYQVFPLVSQNSPKSGADCPK
jgi:Vacuolar sorting-associated protein 13, N-terminal